MTYRDAQSFALIDDNDALCIDADLIFDEIAAEDSLSEAEEAELARWEAEVYADPTGGAPSRY